MEYLLQRKGEKRSIFNWLSECNTQLNSCISFKSTKELAQAFKTINMQENLFLKKTRGAELNEQVKVYNVYYEVCV